MDYDIFCSISKYGFKDIKTDTILLGHVLTQTVTNKKYRVIFSHPQIVVLESCDEVIIVYNENRVK